VKRKILHRFFVAKLFRTTVSYFIIITHFIQDVAKHNFGVFYDPQCICRLELHKRSLYRDICSTFV